ncbi:MAG: hypothetical protein CMP10_14115 [Zetaproteobacteria bacterium]|nr:hypothetical protein [Pseudobdellovibrionaceae bacterium]
MTTTESINTTPATPVPVPTAATVEVSTPSTVNPVDPLESATASVTFTPGTKLAEIERIVILETLKQKSFNRTHTARALGIGIRTLQRKLKRYGASDWGLKTWKVQ